jgi:hypothetical protein
MLSRQKSRNQQQEIHYNKKTETNAVNKGTQSRSELHEDALVSILNTTRLSNPEDHSLNVLLYSGLYVVIVSVWSLASNEEHPNNYEH